MIKYASPQAIRLLLLDDVLLSTKCHSNFVGSFLLASNWCEDFSIYLAVHDLCIYHIHLYDGDRAY